MGFDLLDAAVIAYVSIFINSNDVVTKKDVSGPCKVSRFFVSILPIILAAAFQSGVTKNVI